jgi:uncharacterized protein YbaP (TraB family)
MRLRIGKVVLGLGLVGLTGGWLQAQTAPAAKITNATPALWKVKGVHGTVYLFGTVHVMRKDLNWETPAITAAFKSSDVMYLEIPGVDEEATKKMQPLVIQLGLDPGHPLSTKISAADVTALDAALKNLGMPGEEAVEPMQPWLVYLTLSVLPAMKAGYDPTSGIDKVLEGQAKAQNKPVKGFETIEQQVHLLADFPQAQQVALLHQEIEDLPKSVAQVDEVTDDWAKGEVEKIGVIDNGELKAKHPELYQKILVDRNKGFADGISTMLKDPATGTVFVAIGAAHFAGGDSVVKMLETRGFTVTRVE